MTQYEKVVEDTSLRWFSDAWAPTKESGSKTDLDVQNVSFVEIPFDYAVSYRPGTRLGPKAIIDALNGFSLYCTDKRVDLSSLRFDRHTVKISNDIYHSYEKIVETTVAIPATSIPIFLGGDHSVTDPIIRGLLKRTQGKHFGLIVFDAHFDSRPPIKGNEHSGHWMYTIRDVFEHKSSVQLGVNAPIYSKEYMDDAERSGVLVRTPYEIRKAGWNKTLEEAIEHATQDTNGVYMSVDIDCLDRSVAQGTSVPNACGLMSYEVADAIYEISRRVKLVGFDIVEVSPPLDGSSNTPEVAANFVLNVLAGIVDYNNRQ